MFKLLFVVSFVYRHPSTFQHIVGAQQDEKEAQNLSVRDDTDDLVDCDIKKAENSKCIWSFRSQKTVRSWVKNNNVKIFRQRRCGGIKEIPKTVFIYGLQSVTDETAYTPFASRSHKPLQ